LKPIVDKSVLTRRPRGRIWFGRLSKSFVNRSSKAQFRAGLPKFEHILIEYCDASRLLRSSMGISFASTCKLVAGDVRNAPKQRRSAWFWIGSSIRRYGRWIIWKRDYYTCGECSTQDPSIEMNTFVRHRTEKEQQGNSVFWIDILCHGDVFLLEMHRWGNYWPGR